MNSGIYIDDIRMLYSTDVIKPSMIRQKVIDALKNIDGIEKLIVSGQEIELK
jgi:methyl coenzyme M reductase subunit D